MTYLILTTDIVHAKAKELMEAHGKTTTLDIKKALRDEGYTAVQQDIANAMYFVDGLIEPLNWIYNGTYRTYFKDKGDAHEAFNKNPLDYKQTSWAGWLDVSVDDDDLDVLPSTSIVITATPVQQAKQPTPNPVYTVAPETGDWQVFAYNRNKPTVFVKQGVSRNTARNWYSNVYGVDYLDVAANVYNA